MTKEEKYSLADWAVDCALKNGAQEAGVTISDDQSSSIEVRDKKIDKLEQSNQNSLSIRLFVDNKYSVCSTNRLKKEELSRLITEGISGTRYLSEDEFRTLPDPSLYYKGGGSNLDTFDNQFSSVDPQKKIDLAFAAEGEAYGKDERIISITASYFDGKSGMVMVNSNGFRGDDASTYYGMYTTVSVKGGEARPESYWSESALFFDKLKKSGIGTLALKRTLKKIGQGKIASGKMPMLVENRTAAQLLNPVISALSGSAIQQKNSFLIDMLGKKIGSDKLTLVDDPSIISGRGSRLFDSEGLTAKKRIVFEKGVLQTYFIDTYYGKKLGVDPTSGSTSNLVIEKGTKNLDELVASLKKGILVTGFNGGNSNPTTGDFSYGIEGFLIENGTIVKPVSEMNITGNMKSLWANFLEAGTDVYEDSSWLLPSLVFDQVDFSGI